MSITMNLGQRLSSLDTPCTRHLCVYQHRLRPSFRPSSKNSSAVDFRVHYSSCRTIFRKRSSMNDTSCKASEFQGQVDTAKGKIGFAGIGIMGLAMVTNLLKAGYDVTVWNRSADKCKPLVDLGAKVADSPQDLAKKCDVVLAMLADPNAAEKVAEGIAEGISEGKGYVDVSTIDGETANRIREKIQRKGARYLEAPVSGSKQPAEQGQLIFLAAGDKDLYDFASPLLDVMGKAKFYLGEVGNGANMKLVVNMLMGSLLASFSEALTFTKAAGLSQEQLIEVVGLGTVAAPMFAVKGPKMVQGEFPTAFPLKHQRKDLELAIKYASAQGHELPIASAATSLYNKAETEGHGDEDFSAVLTALNK